MNREVARAKFFSGGGTKLEWSNAARNSVAQNKKIRKAAAVRSKEDEVSATHNENTAKSDPWLSRDASLPMRRFSAGPRLDCLCQARARRASWAPNGRSNSSGECQSKKQNAAASEAVSAGCLVASTRTEARKSRPIDPWWVARRAAWQARRNAGDLRFIRPEKRFGTTEQGALRFCVSSATVRPNKDLKAQQEGVSIKPMVAKRPAARVYRNQAPPHHTE